MFDAASTKLNTMQILSIKINYTLNHWNSVFSYRNCLLVLSTPRNNITFRGLLLFTILCVFPESKLWKYKSLENSNIHLMNVCRQDFMSFCMEYTIHFFLFSTDCHSDKIYQSDIFAVCNLHIDFSITFYVEWYESVYNNSLLKLLSSSHLRCYD